MGKRPRLGIFYHFYFFIFVLFFYPPFLILFFYPHPELVQILDGAMIWVAASFALKASVKPLVGGQRVKAGWVLFGCGPAVSSRLGRPAMGRISPGQSRLGTSGQRPDLSRFSPATASTDASRSGGHFGLMSAILLLGAASRDP